MREKGGGRGKKKLDKIRVFKKLKKEKENEYTRLTYIDLQTDYEISLFGEAVRRIIYYPSIVLSAIGGLCIIASVF